MGGWREVGCTGTGASFRFDPFNAKRKGQPRTNTLSLPSSASSSATSPTENASEITGMRPTWTRLAKSVTTKPLNLRHASASLLPPIPLYRALLRAHRKLPSEMRSLGDDYVKSEFRRHKDVTNPVYTMGFLTQWKTYLDQLPVGSDARAYRGKKLDSTIFEKMSSEQLAQLYEVMHVTKDVWKPVEPMEEDAQETRNPGSRRL